MNNILITGGAGFIGYHLAKHLAQTNKVILCDNLFRGKMDRELQELLKNKDVEFINCDLTKPDQLDRLPNNIRYVYHLAAINGTKYFYEIPHTVLKVNILATINMLDWFVASRAHKILFSSSSETYAGTMMRYGLKIPTPENVPLCIEDVTNPRWSYGGSKITGELLFINYTRVYKRRMTIVRYHNAYGPRMGYEHVIPQFCGRIFRKTNPLKIYGGKETRTFCFIDDIVSATKHCMESQLTDGQIINIGRQTDEISIEALAQKMIALAGIPLKLELNPAPAGSVARRHPDISKLKKLAMFTPHISLEVGLKKTLDWYKLHPEP